MLVSEEILSILFIKNYIVKLMRFLIGMSNIIEFMIVEMFLLLLKFKKGE